MTRDQLIDYAEQKKNAAAVLFGTRVERHDRVREEAKICADIMANVTADKGADGKPLYSNEQARKAEAQRREDASDDLRLIRIALARIDSQIAGAEIDLAFYNDMIRIGCAFAAVQEPAF